MIKYDNLNVSNQIWFIKDHSFAILKVYYAYFKPKKNHIVNYANNSAMKYQFFFTQFILFLRSEKIKTGTQWTTRIMKNNYT